MPRVLRADLRYAHPLAAVLAMLPDAAYAAAVVEATGGQDPEISVTGDVLSGFTVVMARSLPTDSMPSFVSPFVGSGGLRLTETRVWAGGDPGAARTGQLTVDFQGAPLKVSGTLSLAPDGDATLVRIDAAAKASIPLVGGKIEQFAVDWMQKFVRREQKVGDEHLAR